MNTLSLASLLVPLLIPLGTAPGPKSAPLPGAATVSAVVPQEVQEEDPWDAWKEKFNQARRINAKSEMARIVKSGDSFALGWAIVTCEQISERSSDELENFIAALDEAWTTAFKARAINKIYEFFALMDPRMKGEHKKLVEEYTELLAQYEKVKGTKDHVSFTRLGLKTDAVARAFVDLGSHFYASEAYLLNANCWDKGQRGPEADLFKATKAYALMLEQRKKIELLDSTYQSNEVVYNGYKAKGYHLDPAELESKPGPGPGVVAASASLSLPLAFEALDVKPEAYLRPGYGLDSIFPTWTSVGLGKVGTTAVFPNIENSPTVIREGANNVQVDVDGDGKGDVRVPLSGNFETVSLKLEIAGRQLDWAFVAKVGNEDSTFHGLKMNLAPSPESMILFVAGAGSMVIDVEGVPVRIIDDNMDGVYGSAPKAWGHVGVGKDQFQNELDSVLVGKSKRARPWSEYIKVEDRWMHFEAADDGSMRVTPIEVETGTVQLKFKGGKPAYLVLQGLGILNNAFFDIAAGREVELPEGDYRLLMGELRKGKKDQKQKALIFAGATDSYSVKAGEKTVIELGAPFQFGFEYDVADSSVTVKGDTIYVIGRGGERYGRLWNCVPKVEAFYRRAGTRKSANSEKMKLVGSQEQITELGWKSAWFPLDTVIEKKKRDEQVEVQLVTKKNKLFGKIESEWK